MKQSNFGDYKEYPSTRKLVYRAEFVNYHLNVWIRKLSFKRVDTLQTPLARTEIKCQNQCLLVCSSTKICLLFFSYLPSPLHNLLISLTFIEPRGSWIPSVIISKQRIYLLTSLSHFPKHRCFFPVSDVKEHLREGRGVLTLHP